LLFLDYSNGATERIRSFKNYIVSSTKKKAYNLNNLANIIEGCKRRDKKAQSKLYELFSPGLFALCMRYVENQSDAEDILHDTFIKVFSKIDNYEPKGSFESWLKTIFVNDSLKFLRSRSKSSVFENELMGHEEGGTTDEEALTIKESILNAGFSKMDLLQVLQELPDGYRLVFNLFYFEKYGHKEISKMLDISEGTSKSQLFKAKKVLQVKLYERSCTKQNDEPIELNSDMSLIQK
jgi:RNA polymerase sigma factor (sigma-70 family)